MCEDDVNNIVKLYIQMKQQRGEKAVNINLGVMIMDLDALRRMNFVGKILNLLPSVPPNMWNLYNLFNAILHKNIKLLPMTYNHQYGILCKSPNLYPFFEDEDYLAFQKVTKEGAKIVHFTAVKPWKKITGLEGINWWEIARNAKFDKVISVNMR